MRDLTADERAIVAGGYWSDYEDDSWYSQRFALRDYYFGGGPRYYVDANGLETVVVNASRDEASPYGMQFFWSPSGASSGNGGGGGEKSETPRDTPCVTDKPTEHGNILDLHKGAIDLKVKAYEKYGSGDWEHVGIVWKMPGGDVRTTEPFTSFNREAINAGEMWKAINQIPDGAIILGLFHSQPDNGKMSEKDWNAHHLLFGNPDSPKMIGDGNVLLSNTGRGITADPNGLSYVHDKSTGKIYVYDKSDMGKDKLECHVNERRGG
jgi:hypothetical protein